MPLTRTATPGVYERGSRYVVVYREEGRQRKETVGTYAEARARKLAHDAEARLRLPRADPAQFAEVRLGDLDGKALQGFVTWADQPPGALRVGSRIARSTTP